MGDTNDVKVAIATVSKEEIRERCREAHDRNDRLTVIDTQIAAEAVIDKLRGHILFLSASVLGFVFENLYSRNPRFTEEARKYGFGNIGFGDQIIIQFFYLLLVFGCFDLTRYLNFLGLAFAFVVNLWITTAVSSVPTTETRDAIYSLSFLIGTLLLLMGNQADRGFHALRKKIYDVEDRGLYGDI